MPRKLPDMAYGVAINFESNRIDLKVLSSVPSLKTEVYQTFREFGNCMAIIQMMSAVAETSFHNLMVQISPHLFSKRSNAIKSITGSKGNNTEATISTTIDTEKANDETIDTPDQNINISHSNEEPSDILFLEHFQSMKQIFESKGLRPVHPVLDYIDSDFNEWVNNRSE